MVLISGKSKCEQALMYILRFTYSNAIRFSKLNSKIKRGRHSQQRARKSSKQIYSLLCWLACHITTVIIMITLSVKVISSRKSVSKSNTRALYQWFLLPSSTKYSIDGCVIYMHPFPIILNSLFNESLLNFPLELIAWIVKNTYTSILISH